MMIVSCRIKTIVKQFGIRERRRWSKIVHGLVEEKRVAYNLFAA
jgi:hypothetical protein